MKLFLFLFSLLILTFSLLFYNINYINNIGQIFIKIIKKRKNNNNNIYNKNKIKINNDQIFSSLLYYYSNLKNIDNNFIDDKNNPHNKFHSNYYTSINNTFQYSLLYPIQNNSINNEVLVYNKRFKPLNITHNNYLIENNIKNNNLIKNNYYQKIILNLLILQNSINIIPSPLTKTLISSLYNEKNYIKNIKNKNISNNKSLLNLLNMNKNDLINFKNGNNKVNDYCSLKYLKEENEYSIENLFIFYMNELIFLTSSYNKLFNSYNINNINNISTCSENILNCKNNRDYLQKYNQINFLTNFLYEEDNNTENLFQNLLKNNTNNSPIKDNFSIFNKPLFNYLDLKTYLVSICSSSSNMKSNQRWKRSKNYINEVSPLLVNISSWNTTRGESFFTHFTTNPSYGKMIFFDWPTSEIPNQSFLITNTESINGDFNRNVLVPTQYKNKYLNLLEDKELYNKYSTIVNKEYYLFSFIDKHINSIYYLSKEFNKKLSHINNKKLKFNYFVYVATDSKNNKNNFNEIEIISSSTFCLVLRGNISSNFKFFYVLNWNCIPVVLNDQIYLPFSDYINYKKFSIMLPEDYLLNPDLLIEKLKSYTTSDIEKYKKNIIEAKKLFFYDNYLSNYYETLLLDKYNSEKNEYNLPTMSLLNPISLTLIDLVEKRIMICKKRLEWNSQSNFCNDLLLRESLSKLLIENFDIL